MATLGMIVSRMRAAGESQEAIDAVRREYEKVNPPKSDFKPAALTEAQDFLKDTRAYAPRQVSEEPEDFFGGFHKSLASGEALKAGAKGALGFAKGAVVDLPKSIAGTAKTAAGLLSFGNPQRQIEAGTELWEGIKQLPSHIKETTLRAGSEPEAFGRMVGQFTGQPLVGDAALIGVPKLRMPAAKLVEGTGKLLSKAQPTSAPGNIPVSPRMIGLRTASRAAGAVGRKLQSTGEGMRIRAATATPTKGVPLKGETPGELTSEDLSKFAGGGQGVTRPRPIRFDTRDVSRDPTAFTRPIVETVGEAAARKTEPIDTSRPAGIPSRSVEMPYEPNAVQPAFEGAPGEFVAPGELQPIGVAEPSGFSSRYQDIPFDVSTGPQMQPSPAAAGRLTGNRVPTTEERMASIIEELRQADTQAPGVELPPPPYSQGAGAPPEQPRVDVKTARTPRGGEESPYSHLSLEQLEQILAERKAGGPGIIPPKPGAPVTTPPKSGPTTDPRTMFTPEELELLKSPEAQAALEQMAARDAGVDITTGEILEPPSPPRRAGKKMNAPNLKESANKFARDVEGSKEIPGWAESVAEWLTRKKPTNPLRPEVPEGQVTNRRMFDLSAERGAENRLAAEAAGFADEVSPAGPEFSEDMLLTPEELRNPDVPEMISPVENPFDPRMAPGGVVSETTPVEIPKARPSLLKDEAGAVGPDISKGPRTVAQNSKKYQVTDPNGKRLGDITVDDAQIKHMKTFEKFKDIPDEKIASVIYKTKLKRILDETGLGEGSVTITPISTSAKRAEAVKPAAPSAEKAEAPAVQSRLTKKGETVAEKKAPVPEPEEKLSEPPAEPPKKKTFPSVEERQAKGGRPKTEEMPPIPEAFAGTPAPGMKAESSKGYSASTTIETGKKPRTKVSKADVDSAFSQSGNTYSVRKAAGELEEANAPDVEYKNLMPDSFQFELAEGETFKDRLFRMIEAHREGKAERARQAQPAPEPVAAAPAEDKAARQARIDKFVEEVTGEAPELRAKRLNKPAEPPPPGPEKRKIPKLRGPIPQGARITLKKVNPHTVKEVEDAGFVNSGRFDKDGNPIYVKSQRFSDKANKAAQDFGKKN